MNTWNAAGAYISMQALTGHTMRDEQNVRAQQMTMCPGSGLADAAHTIHVRRGPDLFILWHADVWVAYDQACRR